MFKIFFCVICFVVGCVAVQTPAHGQRSEAEPVDFNRDIRPLMSDRCFHCHGPDAKKVEGDLRLDIEVSAKEFAISPGDPSDSTLIDRIFSEDIEERMPPHDSGKKALTNEEKALFKRWIEEGAVWANHWAWERPVRATPPTVSNQMLVNNPIDQFVLAKLEEAGLTFSSPASKETLIRRASFDLIGLPPSLAETKKFVKRKSDTAFRNEIDRLFSSPHYGERMAVDWLDVARFADSNGFQNDFGRDMSPWRDWVIDTFNSNMPYDQFVIEQLAGDLLPNPTESQRVATGFHRNNKSVTEGGSIEEEWRIENIVDRVETTGSAFMGLTIGCARCHDHKYDPISQKDFYRFFAYFNNTAERGWYNETRGNVGPMISLPTPEQERELEKFETDLAVARDALKDKKSTLTKRYENWFDGISSDRLQEPTFHLPLSGHFEGIKSKNSWNDSAIGKAITFDGTADSSLSVDFDKTIDGNTPFTISAWVYPEGAGAVFSKMDDAAKYRGFDLLVAGDGKLRVHFIHEWQENAIRMLTDAKIPMKKWSHVGLTYDGNSTAAGIKVYINGARAVAPADMNKLDGTIQTDQPFRIGSRSASEFFKGSITEFQFYDHALSAEDFRQSMLASLRQRIPETPNEDQTKTIDAIKKTTIELELTDERKAVSRFQRRKNDFTKKNIRTVMVMEERKEMRPTYRLERGAYDHPDTSEALLPAIPKFLPTLPDGAPNNRLGLAQWLVHEDNPLTARVMVNRMWQQFFGRGLVSTPENFGTQSQLPSHPELLDWLATELIRLEWDIQAMQKLIMSSTTYQQSSDATESLVKEDPENRLLARGPRFRLQAEMVRDNALAISGLLSSKIGGKSVKPYQPDGMWKELAGGASEGDYENDEGEDLYRRSLYTNRKRTVPHATLSTFDAPSFEVCWVMRARTNTPLQALALLNDTTYVEASRNLAQRMLTEGGRKAKKRIVYGFKLATNREPTSKELSILMAGLDGYLDTYEIDDANAELVIQHGESEYERKIDPENLAAYTALASVILNLDETITKE
jgi:hypothetical protein